MKTNRRLAVSADPTHLHAIPNNVSGARRPVDAGTLKAKPLVGFAACSELPGSHPDTIISLDSYRPPTNALSFGKVVLEPSIPKSALRLVKIRYADSDGRRRSASFLVERRYAWRGYQVDAKAIKQTSRVTLSAYDGEDVVATISVGHDSPKGLFVDALFGEALRDMRARGGKVCEFTKLAVDEAIRSKTVIAALFHIAYIQARRMGSCTDLVVEVNPRHVRFYERMLGFTVIGSARIDPRVQAPAALLHLDLGHAEDQIAEFGGKPELAAQVRSLYPFFFSAQEESGIERRLRTLE